ncbi:T9SS type A sorting domain-containing protein [bacterium]|nr:T9SS type A sorting domain-containing protein [bacterium]
MRKAIVILLMLALTCITISAHALEVMQSLTDGNNIRDYAFQGNYVWCATLGSLVRWNILDGTYVQFTTKDGLASNYVITVDIGENNELWIGTMGGLQRYDGTAFTTYTTENSGIPDNGINAVALDEHGTVWVGTGGGLACFNGSTWKTYTAENSGILVDPVASIAVDKNGIIWLSHDLNGMESKKRVVMSFDGTTFVNYGSLNKGATYVRKIAVDNDNNKWFLSPYGLYRFDGKTFTKQKDVSVVSSVYTDRDGKVWVTCGGPPSYSAAYRSIKCFDGVSWTEYHFEDLIPYTITAYWDIKLDSDGTLWFVSMDTTGGVYSLHSYNGSELKTYLTRGPRSYNMQDLFIDRNGTKWFGTYFGAAEFDGSGWENHIFSLSENDIPPNSSLIQYNSITNAVLCIGEDQDNVLWMGTAYGIRSFDGSTLTFYGPANTNNVVYTSIVDCAVDKDNVKWFASGRNICSFDGTTWTPYHTFEFITSSVVVDADNIKWFGTYDKGVWSFDGSTWINYTEENGAPKGNIMVAAVDRDNIKWFGTDDGIWSFNGTAWTFYDKDIIGIPDHAAINDIEVDAYNRLWCVINGSLASFDGVSWTVYDRETTGSVSKIAIDGEGVLWLGGFGGVGDAGVVQSFKISAEPAVVEEKNSLPTALKINGNYPNPFNPSTTIEFMIPDPGTVNLSIYSISGQKIRELVAGNLSAGSHSAAWDGRDSSGNCVSSGVYITQLRLGDRIATHRMLLMK